MIVASYAGIGENRAARVERERARIAHRENLCGLRIDNNAVGDADDLLEDRDTLSDRREVTRDVVTRSEPSGSRRVEFGSGRRRCRQNVETTAGLEGMDEDRRDGRAGAFRQAVGGGGEGIDDHLRPAGERRPLRRRGGLGRRCAFRGKLRCRAWAWARCRARGDGMRRGERRQGTEGEHREEESSHGRSFRGFRRRTAVSRLGNQRSRRAEGSSPRVLRASQDVRVPAILRRARRQSGRRETPNDRAGS